MTPQQAVRTGTSVVNLPVVATLIAGFIISGRLLYGWNILFGCLGTIATAWLYWSIALPRWRAWALRSGVDSETLQFLATRAGLAWSRRSAFEKTELPLGAKRH